jgi:hypothetical protein
MQDVSVSNVKERRTRWREESYPACVVQCRCIKVVSFVVRCLCHWKIKSDEEAKKKRKNEDGKQWKLIALWRS